MATAAAILNTKYQSKDGTYPIVIRLIDGKKQRLHPVRYKVQKKQWTNGQVKGHPDAVIINSVIDEELLKAKRYFADCRIHGVPIDLDLAFKSVKSHNWTEYLRHRAKQHGEASEIEMQLKASRFAKEFTECFGRDLYFSELTQDNLRQYNAWLKPRNSANTRAKKFEFLGKYFSAAIREGKTLQANPFREFKIATTPVKKDKLTVDQIKAIAGMELAPGMLSYARDIFMFSYYCKGARFETCLLMRREQIKGDRLEFQINKGKKHLTVPMHQKLREIIERNSSDSPYIFNRVKVDYDELMRSPKLKRQVIGSENANVNRALKTVAAAAEINIPLSMHHARHSLAFHLKQTSGNIGAIADILGHSKTSTTEVYLKSLDDRYLDSVLDGVYE